MIDPQVIFKNGKRIPLSSFGKVWLKPWLKYYVSLHMNDDYFDTLLKHFRWCNFKICILKGEIIIYLGDYSSESIIFRCNRLKDKNVTFYSIIRNSGFVTDIYENFEDIFNLLKSKEFNYYFIKLQSDYINKTHRIELAEKNIELKLIREQNETLIKQNSQILEENEKLKMLLSVHLIDFEKIIGDKKLSNYQNIEGDEEDGGGEDGDDEKIEKNLKETQSLQGENLEKKKDDKEFGEVDETNLIKRICRDDIRRELI